MNFNTIILFAFVMMMAVTTATGIICPRDWSYYAEEEKCFYLTPNKETFEEANATCLALGARLASIHSENEKNFVHAYLRNSNPFWIWMDLLTQTKGGTWKWSDGTTTKYTNFGRNNNNVKTNVCVLTRSGSWFSLDVLSGFTKHFQALCAKEEPSVCPRDWSYYAEEKRCFYLTPDSETFAEANATCLALGARLASIHSENENNFVHAYLQNSNPFWIWINLLTQTNDGKWKWADGTTTNYTNLGWQNNEPSTDLGVLTRDYKDWWPVDVFRNGFSEQFHALCAKRSNY